MEEEKPSVVMPQVSSSEDDASQESDISEDVRDSTLERDEEFATIDLKSDNFQVAGEVVRRSEHKFPDGTIYEGEWLGSKKHGQGKLTFTDGGTYDGEWKDNKPHGYGERTHADGSTYKGQFVNGKADGYGEFSHGNNGLYIGMWK
jgi:hypothetical protein